MIDGAIADQTRNDGNDRDQSQDSSRQSRDLTVKIKYRDHDPDYDPDDPFNNVQVVDHPSHLPLFSDKLDQKRHPDNYPQADHTGQDKLHYFHTVHFTSHPFKELWGNDRAMNCWCQCFGGQGLGPPRLSLDSLLSLGIARGKLGT